MHRSVIESLQAPKAIGPYSQAIAVPASRMVFLSGQIPLDPGTGELVTGDVSAQTAQVMKNLGAVLTAAGVSFEEIHARAMAGELAPDGPPLAVPRVEA